MTGYSGNVSYVRPIFERLAPTPGDLVERILYQASAVMLISSPFNHCGPVPSSMIDLYSIDACLYNDGLGYDCCAHVMHYQHCATVQ